MEAIFDKLLHILGLLGVGIIILFAAGFWLFHLLKKDVENEERTREDADPD